MMIWRTGSASADGQAGTSPHFGVLDLAHIRVRTAHVTP